MRTDVRIIHETRTAVQSGGHAGGVGSVSRIVGELQPIKPDDTYTVLVCQCGSVYRFRLVPAAERRRKCLRNIRRRGRWLLVGAPVSGLGAWLAFTTGHALLVKVLGWLCFAPGLLVSVGALIALLASWPKSYSLQLAPGSRHPISAVNTTIIHRPRYW